MRRSGRYNTRMRYDPDSLGAPVFASAEAVVACLMDEGDLTLELAGLLADTAVALFVAARLGLLTHREIQDQVAATYGIGRVPSIRVLQRFNSNMQDSADRMSLGAQAR